MSDFLAIRRGGSFLQRKSSSQRMRDRDTAGGRIKPHAQAGTSVKKKKKQKSHIDSHWEDVLRDTWS